jgi:hypothetical protein
MITEQINASVATRGVIEEVSFNLDREGLPVILGILRNQLYSNKELAVIREYSCNAMDAMVQAGKASQPIKITLPNRLEPFFKIRDFGAALSEAEIKKIFVSYGASTKRDSNSYVGCMGIGAKSGFAYSDSFLVVSYHQGVKRTYSAFIDPSQIGKLALLGEEDSQEEQGLEIVIPVRDEDIFKFINEAQKFFKYWLNKPIFEGAEISFPVQNVFYEAADKSWVIYEGQQPSYGRQAFDTPVVVMGNVAYPIRTSSLDFNGRDSSLKNLLDCGIRIYVNIGDLEVSASREDLQYTAHTQQSIFAALALAKNEIITTFQKEIDSCQTMTSAKRIYHRVFNTTSNIGALRDVFLSALVYKGNRVTSGHWNCDEKAFKAINFYAKGFGRRPRSDSVWHLNPLEENVFVLHNDLTISNLTQRIAPLLELNINAVGGKKKNVILIKIVDATLWQKWKDDNSFDVDIINLSDLPALKIKDIYGEIDYVANKNAKHSSKVFVFDYGTYHGSYEANSSWWKTAEVDLEEDDGYYFQIERFEVYSGSRYYAPAEFSELLNLVKDAGITLPTNVYGIKKAVLDKGKPENMTLFWDHVKELIVDKIKTMQFEQKYIDRVAARGFKNDYNNFCARLKDINAKQGGELDTLVTQLNAMSNEADAKVIDALLTLAQRLSISIKLDNVVQSHDLNASMAIVKKKYPLIKPMLQQDCFGYYWNSWLEYFNEYIKMIES